MFKKDGLDFASYVLLPLFSFIMRLMYRYVEIRLLYAQVQWNKVHVLHLEKKCARIVPIRDNRGAFEH